MSPVAEQLDIGDLDRHVAEVCARLRGNTDPLIAHSLRLACRLTAEGHICVHLADWAGRALSADLVAPALDAWCAALSESGMVGRPGEVHPFILDDAGRLYLYRYWSYERTLAADLLARIATPVPLDPAALGRALDALFEPAPDGTESRQRLAAATAAQQHLTIISGGPGTGKTSTVVKILALLCRLGEARPERIKLAAPTGKAAARLQDAIRAQRTVFDQAGGAGVPLEPATLHRLLGYQPGSVRFRHDRENPLAADVVVVDEASMVDLALMAKLVRAVPDRARLILLGDKDQLASVEAGAVLGDLCAGAGAPRAHTSPGIAGCIVELDRSYRFDAGSGIGRLARFINAGDGAAVREFLEGGASAQVRWHAVADPAELGRRLAADVDVSPLVTAGSAEDALNSLDRLRILAAHRGGPFGVDLLNERVEGDLARHGLIRRSSGWYAGRPVLVTANDYNLKLFNGDLGIVRSDGEGYRVCFRGEHAIRKFPPARLPQHETAYALTVHRSQGSEADEVLLVLPPVLTPVLTRELLYTAVTRAKQRVQIWGTAAVIEAAVRRRVTRSSGLRDALWGV